MGYIKNLIERMRSDKELPQSGPFKTSADTVTFQALREAEKIDNVAYLEELTEYMQSTKKWKDIVDVAFICEWLIHNTNNDDARTFYIQLKRKRASSNTMMYLIDGATKGKIREYAPQVREMMDIEVRSNVHFSSGIEFLSEVLKDEAVHEIGEILDNDCYGRCEPFYCCIALERIGSSEAIPYLERAIERTKGGRKGWQRDVVAYSKMAIIKIKEANK